MSVREEVLLAIRQAGVCSEVLEARLEYAGAANLLHQHIEPMVGQAYVYPRMLQPQASGRLSISGPPLGNFTADTKYGLRGLRDVVRPDSGFKWVGFDFEAVEARLVSHGCRDPVDAETFRRGWDIHTVTGIRMLHWPEPSFEPTKANLFYTSQGAEWCNEIGHIRGLKDLEGTVIPYSGSDTWRTLFKNARYTMQYSKRVEAMIRYAVELRMSPESMVMFGRYYVNSKPWLTAWKQKVWEECWRAKESRTYFGRRRCFYGGTRYEVEKEGLNHMIQGTVADLLKMTLHAIVREWPGTVRLAFQTHDGARLVVPASLDIFPRLKEIVERTWTIDGREIAFPAEYEEIIVA